MVAAEVLEEEKQRRQELERMREEIRALETSKKKKKKGPIVASWAPVCLCNQGLNLIFGH